MDIISINLNFIKKKWGDYKVCDNIQPCDTLLKKKDDYMYEDWKHKCILLYEMSHTSAPTCKNTSWPRNYKSGLIIIH